MKRDKRLRNVRVILVLALVALLFISAYEVVNYGHEAKWTAMLPDDDYLQIKQSGDGTIYVYGPQYGLRAFSQDGKLKWTYPNAGWPAISENGTAYFGRQAGFTPFGFNALTPDGQISWSYPVSNGSFGIPMIGPEGTIYALHGIWPYNMNLGYEFMAFSPRGQLVWKQWLQHYAGFTVCENGTVLLNTDDNNITAFNNEGNILWRLSNGVELTLTIVANDRIYQGVNLGGAEGIRADLYATTLNGSLLWRYPDYISNSTHNFGNLSCKVAFVDNSGVIYFIRYNATGLTPYTSLFAINPNGTLRWEYRNSTIGNLAIQGDTIVLQTSHGLTVLNRDGHVKCRVSGNYASSSAIAIDMDGTIYAITATSDVWNMPSGIVAIGVNPTLPLIAAFVVIPILMICLVIIWKGKK